MNWRDEHKRMELQWMLLKDAYSELAVAIGATPLPLWGDPVESHKEVLEMARKLRALEQLARK